MFASFELGVLPLLKPETTLNQRRCNVMATQCNDAVMMFLLN